MHLSKKKYDTVKPDLGIIIATKGRDGELHTDTIVNCDAEFLSSRSSLVLQTSDLSRIGADRTLYLCGHGNKKKRTISDLTMKQLAALLAKQKYRGKQTIKLASCNSLRKKKGQDLADELRHELQILGITADCTAMAKDTSFFWRENDDCRYSSVHFNSGSNKIFHKFQNLLFKDVCVRKRKQDFSKNRELVNQWNQAVASGSLSPVFAFTSGILPMICTAIIGIAMNINMPSSPTNAFAVAAINAYLVGEAFYFTGMSSGIICMLPLFAIFTPFAIIRMIIAIVTAIIANIKVAKKFRIR